MRLGPATGVPASLNETVPPAAWDNNDEHFKEYADGSEGCIHRKATIDKWYEKYKKAMREGRFY